MLSRWATYLERFNYVIVHKSGITNRVVDVLSHCVTLLFTFSNEISGFKQLKELYEHDTDFGGVWNKYMLKQPLHDYLVQNRYLFKGSRLCIPRSSLRDKLLGNCILVI
jgi:hypothetical protein